MIYSKILDITGILAIFFAVYPSNQGPTHLKFLMSIRRSVLTFRNVPIQSANYAVEF